MSEAAGGYALPNTRKIFWDIVREETSEWEGGSGDSYTVMLPTTVRNPRKRPYVSEPFGAPIPSRVPPISGLSEKKLLASLLGELNLICGLNLDSVPETGRDIGTPASHDECRTVLIGASHMCRLANAFILEGDEVANLATPGWIPTKENLAKAAEFCEKFNLTKRDKVILDLWSNSSYMGSDEVGLPSKAYRCDRDGRYHLMGPLQTAPQQVFKNLVNDATDLVAACGGALVVLVAPFPRYVGEGCCDNPQHVSNSGQSEILSEFEKAAVFAANAIGSVAALSGCVLYNLADSFGNDKDFFDMVTSTGAPLWPSGDPVHLAAEAYREVAASLAELARPAEGQKRSRIDSLVPGPPQKKRRGPVIMPAPWVAGIRVEPGGRGTRGRGYQSRGGRWSANSFRGRGGWKTGSHLDGSARGRGGPARRRRGGRF